MKVIICGGREYELTPLDKNWLDDLHARYSFSLVIEGGCRRKDDYGNQLPTADLGGYLWARSRGIQTATMDANWPLFDKAAGPIRNDRMAAFGDMVIAFPGGRGTESMIRIGKSYGLQVKQPPTPKGD